MAAGVDVNVAGPIIPIVQAKAPRSAVLDEIAMVLLAGYPKHPLVRLHEASQRRSVFVERSAFELRPMQPIDQPLSGHAHGVDWKPWEQSTSDVEPLRDGV